MKPETFKGYTAVLGAPPRWEKEKYGPCLGLPVRQRDLIVTSCWRPSWWERIALLFGARVFLNVASGITQPPVSLEVARKP